MNGRNGGVPGRTKLIEPGKKTGRVEVWCADDAGASRERAQQGGHESVHVKERHDVQTAIVWCELEGPSDVRR